MFFYLAWCYFRLDLSVKLSNAHVFVGFKF